MQTETLSAKKGRAPKKPIPNGKDQGTSPGEGNKPVANTSGFYAFEYKVLVVPDEFQNVTKGGIIIPDETVDMEQRAVSRGILVDLSPLAFTYDKWPEGTRIPKRGDRVLYGKYAGSDIVSRLDGKKYRVMNDKDIICLIDEDA